jgi:hypothetical protein
MPTKVTETVLPTTMIGSYPKPRWYTHYNIAGEDLLEWWKLEGNWHAYWDATTACIKDQELAGLDIVTDGQMHFADYGGGIGSFVWYWYERLGGFTKAKLPNPLARQIEESEDGDLSQAAWMHNWGGTAVTEPVSRGIPGRLAEMYEVASQLTAKPLKVSVSAGPPNLTYHVDFKALGSKYTSARQLAEDLVPVGLAPARTARIPASRSPRPRRMNAIGAAPVKSSAEASLAPVPPSPCSIRRRGGSARRTRSRRPRCRRAADSGSRPSLDASSGGGSAGVDMAAFAQPRP